MYEIVFGIEFAPVVGVVVVIAIGRVGLIGPVCTIDPISDNKQQVEHNTILDEEIEERHSKAHVGEILPVSTYIDRLPLDDIVTTLTYRLL